MKKVVGLIINLFIRTYRFGPIINYKLSGIGRIEFSSSVFIVAEKDNRQILLQMEL